MRSGATRLHPTQSIVLPSDSAITIQPVLDHLAGLEDIGPVEVVVVLPHGDGNRISSPLDVRVVGIDSVYPLSEARAAGVRAATGNYVFIGETHSFPRPGMFTALRRAHARGYAVVVPVFENENPVGAVSWAGFLNGYAAWAEGQRDDELTYAPLFNASYDRGFLLKLGDELPGTLTTGEDMMSRLRAVGGRVWLESSARIGHVNIARLRDWLPQRYVAGRVIASVRSARWARHRRLAFALGSPGIPLVLFNRIRHGILRTMERHGVTPAVIPVILLGMFVQAVGEAAGYAAGSSARASRRYDEYEVKQMSYR